MKSKDKIIAVSLGIVIFLVLFATSGDYGVIWDEPIYLKQVNLINAWSSAILGGRVSAALSSDTLREVWALVYHPPFAKLLSYASWKMLRGLLSDIPSMRVSVMLLFSLMLSSIYLFMKQNHNRTAALFTVFCLLFMPRVFADAHFAALDVPMTAMWVMTVIAFAKGISERKWTFITALLFGLSLATKLHGFFLFFAMTVWALIFYRKKMKNLLYIFIIGVIIFFACWPYFWTTPVTSFKEYVSFLLRVPVNSVYYLGRAYGDRVAPWHYPFVLTCVVVPAHFLLLSALGVWRTFKERDGIRWLILINAFVPIFFVALPGSLKYDGARLFSPSFPFIAMLAGIGFDILSKTVKSKIKAKKMSAEYALLAVFLLPALFVLVRAYPCHQAYYNMFIGGARGAEKLGMETTYWGSEINKKFLDYLNGVAKPGARMKFLPVSPQALKEAGIKNTSALPWVVNYYQARGLLRKDILLYESPPYDYIVLQSRQGYFDKYCWRLYDGEYENARKIHSVTCDGVPLVSVYEMEKR